MNKKKYICLMLGLVFMVSSCYDRDVLDRKEGYELPPVSNLSSTLSNTDQLSVSWTNPSDIPSSFERPVNVYIQLYRGTVIEYQIILQDEPATWNYTLSEPDSEYRVVVKMHGLLKEPEYGKSDEVYSLGQTVTIQ